MTKVEIVKSSDGSYKSFCVSGHCGYAEHGNDIVCAAISFMVLNTINSIEKFTCDKINVIKRDEDAVIDCKFEEKNSDETILLMNSFVLGMKELSKDDGLYSKFVKLIIREV